jgi:hypothetical protein
MMVFNKDRHKNKQVSRSQIEESRAVSEGNSLSDFERTDTGFRTIGKLRLRGKNDDLPQ